MASLGFRNPTKFHNKSWSLSDLIPLNEIYYIENIIIVIFLGPLIKRKKIPSGLTGKKQ